MHKIILTVLLLPVFCFSESVLVKLNNSLNSQQLEHLASSLRTTSKSIEKIPLVDKWDEIQSDKCQESDFRDPAAFLRFEVL